ncbi:MAG: hypothetical protein H6737_06050 [Alphaproteobacteria bacterium]|nr:hypothetical protein [Alphaproteobacteria bacterium]
MRLSFLLLSLAACTPGSDPDPTESDMPSFFDLIDALGDISDFSESPAPPTVAPGETAAPSGVDAACWSWQVRTDPGGAVPPDLTFQAYDPGTLKLLTSATDDQADGVWDTTVLQIWDASFDNLLRQRAGDRITVDTYADGVRIFTGIDEDGDGALEVATRFRAEDGRVVSGERDETGDAVADVGITFRYDAQGRETAIEEDRGFDGTLDASSERTFEDLGDGRSRERLAIDEDGDGTVDVTSIRITDAAGLLVEQRFHQADGLGLEYEHTYDADGVLTETAFTLTQDGVQVGSTATTRFVYEAPGRIATAHVYIGGEIHTESNWTWACP